MLLLMRTGARTVRARHVSQVDFFKLQVIRAAYFVAMETVLFEQNKQKHNCMHCTMSVVCHSLYVVRYFFFIIIIHSFNSHGNGQGHVKVSKLIYYLARTD